MRLEGDLPYMSEQNVLCLYLCKFLARPGKVDDNKNVLRIYNICEDHLPARADVAEESKTFCYERATEQPGSSCVIFEILFKRIQDESDKGRDNG